MSVAAPVPTSGRRRLFHKQVRVPKTRVVSGNGTDRIISPGRRAFLPGPPTFPILFPIALQWSEITEGGKKEDRVQHASLFIGTEHFQQMNKYLFLNGNETVGYFRSMVRKSIPNEN